MVSKEERNIQYEYFARASRSKPKMWGGINGDDERTNDGALVFKRKALGFCGKITLKTLDEMARLLHETGMASSVEEGKEIAPKLDGAFIWYDPTYVLKINRFQNRKGNERYKIQSSFNPFLIGW